MAEEKHFDRISRRSLLKGAAAVTTSPEGAARAAAGTLGIEGVSGATLIPPELVGRAAARIAPLVKLFVLFRRADESADHWAREHADDGTKEELDALKKLAEYVTHPQAELKPEAARIIASALESLTGIQNMSSPQVTLGELLDQNVLAQAYELAGAAEGERPGAEMLQNIATSIQQATGLAPSATLAQSQASVEKLQTDFAAKVLSHIDQISDPITKKNVLQDVRLSLADSPANEDLREKFLAKETELRPLWEAAYEAEESTRIQRVTDESNRTIESRTGIYCDVDSVASNERTIGKLRTFRIRPVNQTLTRMGLEHFRQYLYFKAQKLDEYVPAEPVIRGDAESASSGLLIDTSDRLLIEALEKASTVGGRIIIPDRLQHVFYR